MRKLILPFLAAALCSVAATAQTEKGKFMVGAGLADVSAGMQKGGEAIDYISGSIHPRAGYFICNNFALGTMLGLGISKAGSVTDFNYGIEPFVRYYFGSKKTRLFAEASGGIYGYKVDGVTTGFSDGNTFTFAAGPGVTHFINPNVGLEVSLLFRGNKDSHISDMSYNPSLSFGFQIYLGGHKHKAVKAEDAEEDAPDDKDEKADKKGNN